MTKVVAYTHAQDSLPFSRRVRLPFTMLREWGNCTSFQIHSLGEEEELSEGMLMGPDLVIFQNFIPRSEVEAQLLAEVARRLQWSGKAALWWYDLEDPALLKDSRVLALLPLMRVVTVPNVYLEKELETFSRVSLQQIEILPSTYDLAEFQQAFKSTTRIKGQMVLGCLGDHDWETFLPGFVKALETHMTTQELRRFHIVTDNLRVITHFAPLGISGSLIGEGKGILHSMYYPAQLARCSIGLIPREGKDGREVCWQWEYGAMGTPTFAALHSSYDTTQGKEWGCMFLPFDQPDLWVKAFYPFMAYEGPMYRRHLGRQAFESASYKRVGFATSHYIRVLRQILPVFRSRA